MSVFSRELQPWLWRDPLYKLTHVTSKCISKPIDVSMVWYVTRCDRRLTVDDVNALTKVGGAPTCLRCVVAEPQPDVLHGEE